MPPNGFRIPDKVFATLAIVILFMTWGMLIWAWPMLPAQIPTHFGPSGAADAWSAKTFWTVFLPVVVPTVFGGLFLLLYRHPQYSNIPSSILLTAMPEPERGILLRLIRHLLVMMYVLMTLVFAYICLAVVSVGLGIEPALNAWFMFGLVGFMLVVVAVYTIWMARIARVGVAKLQALKKSGA